MPVIQFICFSSVEAYLPWKCCCVMLHYEFLEPWIALDLLPTLIFVTGNLCNKCPSGYSNKRAVLVILSMRSLVSIEQQSPRRPCDIVFVFAFGLSTYSFHKWIQMVLYFKSWLFFSFANHYTKRILKFFIKTTKIYAIPWTRSYVPVAETHFLLSFL